MYNIEVNVEVPLREADASQVERAVALTLVEESAVPGTQVTVLLTNNETISALNRDFRGIEDATDVLSFEMNEALPDGGVYLGDVIIAVPIATEQAATQGHALDAELALLAIHGVLHLLGYDHALPDEKTAMWSRQRELLAKLGLQASPSE